MTQSSGIQRSRKGQSLRRSVTVTATTALLAISAILIAYVEIRGASLTRRHTDSSVSVQTDLVNTMLNLQHERLGALARQIATDPVVDSALLADSTSADLEEALIIFREDRSERPTLVLASSEGHVIESASDSSVALDPAVLQQAASSVSQTQLLIDEEGSPLLAHRAPVRRGDRIVGAIWAVLPIATGIDEFFPKLAGLAFIDAKGDFRGLFGSEPDLGTVADGGDMRMRNIILSDNDGHRLDATVLPLRFGGAEAIGSLVMLRDVSNALKREELLTTLTLTLVLAIIILSLGVLMQKLRVGFRPLGTVVQLLGSMTDGEMKRHAKSLGKTPAPNDGNRKAGPSFKSGREIDTLLQAVETFRESLKAHSTLIAVTEQLENARRIQQSLLPATFDLHPRWDIYGRMRAAEEVAGDFFDMFVLDDGRIAVLVADVSGKGMAPALFASQASALLRAQCQQSKEPATAIKAANNALCERNPEDMFLTAILALITPETGEISFVNAGHCLPMIASRDGEVRLVTTEPDMVVGVLPDLEWTSHSLNLDPGERLLFYSDGFDEAQTIGGELLGTDGAVKIFKDTCAKAKNRTSQYICRLVLNQIDSFAAGAPQADDISLVVMHCPLIGREDGS